MSALDSLDPRAGGQERGIVPDWLSGSRLWETILVAQHAWTLVLLVLVLLWAGVRERGAAPPELAVAPA